MRVLLLLERDATDVERLQEALALRGHRVARATSEDAQQDLTNDRFATADLIIADSEIEQRFELVKQLALASPGIEFVLIGPKPARTLPADVIGQLDRPVDVERLLGYVDEVADVLDGERLREPSDLVAYETLFAGESPQILSLVRRVRLVARSEAPVWIFGDDGSGRAIIARAIHDRSSRRHHPFIALNSAAHSDEELTHLLFRGDDAAVVRAQQGTVFLEQVSSAGPETQRQLVQFLDRKHIEDKEALSARLLVGIQPAGDGTPTQRLFSSDLYYRLKVLEVELPRLKDRVRDLEQIVGRMLERLAIDGKPPAVSDETIRILERYSFPGNLLELAHALTHAFVVAHGGAIEPQHLPQSIRQPAAAAQNDNDLQSLDMVAGRFERDYLLRVLRSVGGSRNRAAEILGISRKSLWAKLKAHGLSDDDIERDENGANGASDER